MGGKSLHLTGQTFSRLTVVDRVLPNGKDGSRWKCICVCGATVIAYGARLKYGAVESCGCLQRQRTSEAATTHGKSRTRIYNAWLGMHRRCYKSNRNDYHRYGGRGISVCERWHNFDLFYSDMGDPPPRLTLERKDNDGPYSPDNCIWATRSEQGNNTSKNRKVSIGGVEMSVRRACDKLGKRPGTVYQRIYRGATPEEALR